MRQEQGTTAQPAALHMMEVPCAPLEQLPLCFSNHLGRHPGIAGEQCGQQGRTSVFLPRDGGTEIEPIFEETQNAPDCGQVITDKPVIEAKRRQVDAVRAGGLGEIFCLPPAELSPR